MSEENKDLQPNFTMCPNVIFDNWQPHLSAAEFACLMVVVRKTYGWHKTADFIAQSQFEALTGMARNTIKAALNGLIEKDILKIVCLNTARGSTEYTLNLESNFRGSNSDRLRGSKIDRPEGQNLTQQKKVNKVKEKEPDSLPLVPNTFEQKPQKTKQKPKGLEDQEINHILNIMRQHDKGFNRTQEIIKLIKSSIKDNGFEETEKAVLGRLMVKRNKDKSWRWLFIGNSDYIDALGAYEKENAAESDMQKRWTINTDAPADFSDLENKLNSI